MQPQQRCLEIFQATSTVFITKRYRYCSTADLIDASGLSDGGFYHYYREKPELLYDMIELGAKQGIDSTLAYREKHPELSKIDLLVDLTMEKLLDENERKKIYVFFSKSKKMFKQLILLLIGEQEKKNESKAN